jgi:hypothetical protein
MHETPKCLAANGCNGIARTSPLKIVDGFAELLANLFRKRTDGSSRRGMERSPPSLA